MSLRSNVAWTVLSRYGVQVLSLVSNVLLVRYLGAAGYGEYALASAVMLIGNAFTSFGMDMVLIRRVASGETDALLADGLWGQVLLSAAFITGIFVTGFFVLIPLSVKVYTFSLLPLAFYSIFTIAVRARQKMRTFSLAQLWVALLNLLSVLIVWILDANVLVFVLLLLAVQVIVALWGMFHVDGRIFYWRFSFWHIFILLKECSCMAFIGTMRLIYEKIPFTILPSLTSFSAVGLFSSAIRVVEAGKLGHQSALTALYPEMARNVAFGKQMRGLRLLLGAALLISIVLFVLAEPLVFVLFGAEFLSAVLPLRIMAWTVTPYVLVTYISIGLVSMGHERTLLPSRIIILTLLLILLFVLTPRFGIAGSAVAVLAVELIHVGMLWQLWRKYVLSESF